MIVFSLVVERPDGTRSARRMPPGAYRELLAATNMKQRVRKLLEYTWADRLGYAVVGTPNLLEYDQGFFVKGGDGLADVKPIARLYKGQVYALARELGLPEAIATRAPTTETFSLPQTQEEFYFGHPYERMDVLVLGAREGDRARPSSRRRWGSSRREVEAAYGEIERRRVATAYLHAPAVVARPGRLSRCAASPASSAPTPAPPVDETRCCGWRARSATAGPTASGSRSTAAPAWSPRASRSSTSPAAGSRSRPAPTAALLVYNGEVYNHPELRAELERAASASRPPATPRSSCGCSSATASRRSTASTASSRSPGGSPASGG